MFDEGTCGPILRTRSSHDVSGGCDQRSCVALATTLSMPSSRVASLRSAESTQIQRTLNSFW